MNQPVLCDNTILANFAVAHCAAWAMQLWRGALCITPAVRAEHEAGIVSRALSAEVWVNLPVVTLTETEESFAASLSFRLGAGERTSIAVAFHRGGLFARDDGDARRAARQHHLTITGTIGILVMCVQRDLAAREDANERLAIMIAVGGYHSPVASLDELLKH